MSVPDVNPILIGGLPRPLNRVRETWLQQAVRSPHQTAGARMGMAAHCDLTPAELGPSLRLLETRLEQLLMAPMRDMGFLVTRVRLDVGGRPNDADGMTYAFFAELEFVQLDQDCVSMIRQVPAVYAPALAEHHSA